MRIAALITRARAGGIYDFPARGTSGRLINPFLRCQRLRETDEALAAQSFLSVRGCVARTLLELADYIGKDAGRGRIRLDQRISGKDLAAMAGVARENVSRVLSDLRKRGVIEQYSQSYVLNDIRALEREVHH